MFTSLPALLGLTILLGLLHVLFASVLGAASRGGQWNAGNRDGEPPPLGPHAARAERASRNFLETFVFFAAALVCAIAIGRQGDRAILGAQLYFWARLAYLPIYVIGIPYLRSLVWTVALAGLLIVVSVLF
jgi:uncharacterized MAPEG superfamily protein